MTATFANQLLQGAMVFAMVAEVTLMVKTFAGYPLNSTDAVTYAISKIVMIGSNALNTLLKAGIIANDFAKKGTGNQPPEYPQGDGTQSPSEGWEWRG